VVRGLIVYLLLIIIVIMTQGCSDHTEKNTFIISGPIEKIDASYIYVNEFPIPIKDTSEYEVDQIIEAKLYSLSDTDAYHPDLIKLKEIETME